MGRAGWRGKTAPPGSVCHWRASAPGPRRVRGACPSGAHPAGQGGFSARADARGGGSGGWARGPLTGWEGEGQATQRAVQGGGVPRLCLSPTRARMGSASGVVNWIPPALEPHDPATVGRFNWTQRASLFVTMLSHGTGRESRRPHSVPYLSWYRRYRGSAGQNGHISLDRDALHHAKVEWRENRRSAEKSLLGKKRKEPTWACTTLTVTGHRDKLCYGRVKRAPTGRAAGVRSTAAARRAADAPSWSRHPGPRRPPATGGAPPRHGRRMPGFAGLRRGARADARCWWPPAGGPRRHACTTLSDGRFVGRRSCEQQTRAAQEG